MNSMSTLTLVRPQMGAGNVQIKDKITKHLAVDKVQSSFKNY